MVLSEERERLQIYKTMGTGKKNSFLCLDLFIVSRYKKFYCDNLCRYRKCVTVAVEKQHCSSPDETDTGEHHFNRTSAAERRSMYGRQCCN